MRKRWLTCAWVLAPLAGAWAQEEDDGTAQGEFTSPAAACIQRARAETPLSEHAALLLCQGAESDEPVDCFIETSENTFLEQHEVLSLCSPTLSGAVPSVP